MPIRFKCPHCQKPLSVKDHLAGKKAACPVCKKPMTIPAPVAAAAEIEDLAASALADERAPAEAAAKGNGPAAPARTIDFNCPYCDAELHLPGEQGGKQVPCPECKHILKVPKLVAEGPKDWRDVKPTGPTVAQMSQPKEELEGAWGTGVKAKVSRDALEEAGAIEEEPDEPVGIGTWIKRGILAAVVLGAAFYGYTWWSAGRTESRQLAALSKALEYAPDDVEKSKLPPLWAAEVHRGAGEFYIRAKNPEAARKHLLSAMQLAQTTKSAQEQLEGDALLIDIAVTMAELGGSSEAVENKERMNWNEVMVDLTRVMDKIQSAEGRTLAGQEIGGRLRRLGQAGLSKPTAPEGKADGEVEAPKTKADPWTTAVNSAATADATAAKSFIDEAHKHWKNARNQRPAPFLVLQFIRSSARADLAGTKELLKTSPPLDKHVLARANLECLLVHIEQSTNPAEFNLAEEVGDKASSAYAITWSAIARQKTRLGQRSEVLATQPPDEKLTAFLHLGAALGDQDRK